MMNATNFVMYSAGVLLCALAIYAFLAAICKMILSFSSVADIAELERENEELTNEVSNLQDENEELQEALAQVYYTLTNPAGDNAATGGAELTADDVEAEAEGTTGGCHGNGCCGGSK
jgi:hypothetical protein